jgi:hypothetical protein
MEIVNVTYFEVTIRDDSGNTSHVHQQSDGKWKCQRCDRYRCKHVRFVHASHVQLLSREIVPTIDDILTF